MTIEESLGDALREGFGVPTDTMITLDIPLLLTQLSRVPAVPARPVAPTTPPPEDVA